MGRKRSATPDAERYGAHRAAQVVLDKARSAAGRDIGSIPDIGQVKRRARCRRSLRLFCETYNPGLFYLDWSEDQLRAIARIEEAATLGALYALAMPRGSGKTAICRMAALWVVSYHLCRYVFIIGATQQKADDNLDAIKIMIRFLPAYVEDFPEISYPIVSLKGIAQRAHGQTINDQSTLIEWQSDRVVLATVPPPANWPKAWGLRSDGMTPTSGGIISAAGLTGEGIRGSLLTLTTGEMVRPDLVLLDDPQTAESARSPIQNVTRESLVSADVLGMAGPDKKISAVMPCTIIAPGDMADTMLDRSKHPLWRGERTKLLRTMPANMEAWDAYFQLYQECAQTEPPDMTRANAYYLAHREELDRGAFATWPARKLDGEVSAIQRAMHLYFRSPRAFWSEYQNEPLPADYLSEIVELTPDGVSSRLNRLPRGTAPRGSTRLVGAIDVQQRCLFWMVTAWSEDYSGGIVDYGCFPRPNRAYFTASEVRPSLEDQFPGMTESARIYAGLDALVAHLAGREWPKDDDQPMRLERLLVDANWGASTDTVYQFCTRSPHAAILLPSHGKGIGASNIPMRDWPKKPGERRGRDWVIPPRAAGRGRHVTFETNGWKSFVVERLQAPPGSPGTLWLPGTLPHEHQLLADHLCAEYRVRTFGRGREVDEWKARPDHADNHWLDTLVLCAVAASVQGLAWSSAAAAGQPSEAPRPAAARRKLSDVQAQRRASQS